MNNLPKQTAASRLQHFPITFFAMIMGLTGLTLVWEKASHLFAVPGIIGHTLLTLTACLFLILAVLYLCKIILKTPAVLGEFNHPIKLSFFPAVSINMLLLSIATFEVSQQLSFILWSSGSAIHLLLTVYILNQWIHHPKFQMTHMTPAWFIPVVGNILVPIAGVDHGYTEVSWFFFSIGIVFWLVLKTLVLNRMMFHDPIPHKLLPTMFILIAPPAVGFISYVKLNGGMDNFAHILYYTAIFLVLILLAQAPRFTRIQFFMSWWAYSFPLAAAAIATQLMYSIHKQPFFYYLSLALIILSSVVITLLFFRTLLAVIRNELCQPE
ncbi:SLAC1 anion channel family protein [Amphritea sp. 1_MG-2023]|uniref:SLAC1 anion channel family protein n=1 Tax=Amphritea sp. 1_MG-2023 TaxID=3062670 RepID=UPI0026E25EEB|nr:SLAC1 anion channel family protein [Amphritea sp. 1_MG-2023]MDO6562835.1 SLAC1 anion channel family protein [Amphritea sp. 1_MG-2023]